MIRLKDGVVDKLKLLKSLHKKGSYSDIIEELLDECLSNYVVQGVNGPIATGAVVQDRQGRVMVVEDVSKDRVVLMMLKDDEHVYMPARSRYCSTLELLCSSVEEYEG